MKSSERNNIVKFLKGINEKNYAQAHKYLKDSLDHKMRERIDTVVKQGK